MLFLWLFTLVCMVFHSKVKLQFVLICNIVSIFCILVWEWLIILFDNLNCGISANKVFLGASTLEWVLSFCIIIIVFFSSYFKWCLKFNAHNVWRKIIKRIECREVYKFEFFEHQSYFFKRVLTLTLRHSAYSAWWGDEKWKCWLKNLLILRV